MKSATKDRLQLLLIGICFLLMLLGVRYIIGSNIEAISYIGMVKIVRENDEESITIYKKYNNAYGYKIKEQDKFLLKYESGYNKSNLETLMLTEEQYNELVEG
ncbi:MULTISPECIES: hypothetical protein [unclassified Clostridium]|uniref:hypothetical protein n=1 Tax=unclassified Clostridium TaxID=2614128 RepID=UPI000E8AD527|nr:hypothetical protein [Clostridium sp.]